MAGRFLFGILQGMTLDASIMLAGVAVLFLQFLGFPQSWDNIFYIILGICVVALGIVVRRRVGTRRVSREFVESVPSPITHDEAAR